LNCKIQGLKKSDLNPDHFLNETAQNRVLSGKLQETQNYNSIYRKNYFTTMTDSIGNLLSTLKQNIPYFKDHDVSSEVMLGALMHLFLILCFIVLFYLLVRKFM